MSSGRRPSYRLGDLTEAQKGWIAGIVDGEGCIGIYKSGHMMKGFKEDIKNVWR